MSYLRLEKAVMTNLEESLRRELLRTNRSGAYSASTLVDCNTRKYHGLLVVPVPELDDENHVLLSSLDCTVVQHGAEFNLGLHKYQGNNYSPKGHKYIREFNKAYHMKSLDMDLAWSQSVFDQLRFEITCRQVAFAEKAPTEEAQRQYANIRAYGYFKLARLHRRGLFVDTSSQWIDDGIVAEYKREITNTHFVIAPNGKLLIEPKEDIKMRIGRSPDPADALMLACLNRGENDDPKMLARSLRGVTRDEEAEIMGEL